VLDKALSTAPTSVNASVLAIATICTQQKTEADVVVAITRRIVVAIGRTQVLRIIVPTAAANNTVRAFDCYPANRLRLNNPCRKRKLLA
jgi:hypothetical protein